MSKPDQLNDARLDAMRYAVEQIKKTSLEEFEKELRWRGAYRIGAGVSAQQMKKWMYDSEKILYPKMYGALFTALHDQYCFGRKRLNVLNERCCGKIEFLIENPQEWENFEKELEKILHEPLEMKLVNAPK